MIAFRVLSPLLFLSYSALADYVDHKPSVQCRGNNFYVQFFQMASGESLAQALKGTDQIPYSKELAKKFPPPKKIQSSCTLQDGREVEVQSSIGQAYAWGMGGADPASFMTLRLGDRFLYFKSPYRNGRGEETYNYGLIYIENDKLMECQPTSNTCKDVSSRLGSGPNNLPEEEQASLKRLQSILEQERSLTAQCLQLREDLATKGEEFEFSQASTASENDPGVTVASVDINNDGQKEWVYKYSADSGAFSGQALTALNSKRYPKQLNKKEFQKFREALTGSRLDEEKPKLKKAQIYPLDIQLGDYPTNHTTVEVRKVAGRNLLTATPTLLSQIPAFKISEVGADYVVKSLCSYHLHPTVAGFDCNKASTPDEKTICESPILVERDNLLSAIYRIKLELSLHPAKLSKSQKEFLNSRKKCGKEVPCLEKNYLNRYNELLNR